MFVNYWHALFVVFFFFFNDTATTEIYTLSLHDALPIRTSDSFGPWFLGWSSGDAPVPAHGKPEAVEQRSEVVPCRLDRGAHRDSCRDRGMERPQFVPEGLLVGNPVVDRLETGDRPVRM